MDFVARPPRHPALRGVVRTLWHCRNPGAVGRETALPSGTMQLLINVDGGPLHHFSSADSTERSCHTSVVVQGMHAHPYGLDRADQRSLVGVVFEPGAARVVLGVAMDAVAEDNVGLDVLLGGGSSERLLDLVRTQQGARMQLARVEDYLVQRVRDHGRAVDPTVTEALRRMQAGTTEVSALADGLGLAARRLRRRFLAEVGLPPKAMARVVRFQRAVEALRGGQALTSVAQSCGYFDQAHLGHEFCALSGVSPGQYRRRMPPHRNHLA
ncbi:MAG: helix-turn-helix transcriptional regulator [Nannocystaceae bacterium]|nr:helix-turn-helix transcriptional regulator [Nannocystaceae bacterium]